MAKYALDLSSENDVIRHQTGLLFLHRAILHNSDFKKVQFSSVHDKLTGRRRIAKMKCEVVKELQWMKTLAVGLPDRHAGGRNTTSETS